MKKESKFNYRLSLISSLLWAFFFAFVLVDYFASNIPPGVHFVTIWFFAGVQLTLTTLTKYFLNKYREDYVE